MGIESIQVSDLSPLADQLLTVLNCEGKPPVDWSPLARLLLIALDFCHGCF